MRSLPLERRAIGDGVFASQRAAAADVLVVLQLDLAARDADHPGAQHGQQARRGCAGVLASRDRVPHGVHLIGLDVEQEHVGSVGRQVHRELGDQVLLQRAHAEDEEAAQADGQQDDPHLRSGTAQLEHGVTQGEPARPRQRTNQPNQQRTRQVQNQRGDGQARRSRPARPATIPPARQ